MRVYKKTVFQEKIKKRLSKASNAVIVQHYTNQAKSYNSIVKYVLLNGSECWKVVP